MLIIAHRGAWAEGARPTEQTRAAFRAAFELGADGVECDVRLTADGAVVCHHDADVDRLSDGTGAVDTATLADLRALTWGASADETLITLAELIELTRAAGRPVLLAIELKHPNPRGLALESAVLDVLDAAGWDPGTASIGDVAISLMSFNPATVPALAPRVAPSHITILTAEAGLDDLGYALDTSGADPAERAELAAQLEDALRLGRELADTGHVGGVGPDIDLVRRDPAAVARWIAAGQAVRVWTVDDPADIDLCVGLGVPQIETDWPAAALRRLGRA